MRKAYYIFFMIGFLAINDNAWSSCDCFCRIKQPDGKILNREVAWVENETKCAEICDHYYPENVGSVCEFYN